MHTTRKAPVALDNTTTTTTQKAPAGLRSRGSLCVSLPRCARSLQCLRRRASRSPAAPFGPTRQHRVRAASGGADARSGRARPPLGTRSGPLTSPSARPSQCSGRALGVHVVRPARAARELPDGHCARVARGRAALATRRQRYMTMHAHSASWVCILDAMAAGVLTVRVPRALRPRSSL
jgi:hypothetical protein